MDTIKASLYGFQQRLKHRQAHTADRSQQIFYEVMLKYYQMVDKGREEGRPLAWVGLAPVEIVYAMDILPFMPEFQCMVVASQGNIAGYFDASAGYGLPIEICSVHRAMTGMDILQELPKPDLILSSACVCDSTLKFYGTRTEYHQVPSYMLDLPHWRDEEAIQYLTKDLEGMVHFLEEFTGKKMDYDRLKEIMRLSKEGYDLFYEIGELRKAAPTPLRAREAFRNFSVWAFMLGKQEAIDYFRLMRDETRRRVENKEGAVADEKYRIVWLYIPPNYALSVFDWMETEYGATIPMDVFNFLGEFEWDPDKPLETLARKAYYSLLIRQLGGPIENATDEAVRMVKEYKADGAVWLTQIGCKQGCAVIRRMKDVLQEELGVPFLSMDGDVIDPSVLPPDELKSKLEGFFEILEDRVAVH